MSCTYVVIIKKSLTFFLQCLSRSSRLGNLILHMGQCQVVFFGAPRHLGTCWFIEVASSDIHVHWGQPHICTKSNIKWISIMAQQFHKSDTNIKIYTWYLFLVWHFSWCSTKYWRDLNCLVFAHPGNEQRRLSASSYNI